VWRWLIRSFLNFSQLALVRWRRAFYSIAVGIIIPVILWRRREVISVVVRRWRRCSDGKLLAVRRRKRSCDDEAAANEQEK
jgi:hypothetical protein